MWTLAGQIEREGQSMSNLSILYDEPQEAAWFRALHPDLAGAEEEAISVAESRPGVQGVLAYDRPDIVLLDRGTPILVVEETVEVPSGHNVGQRFARIAASAECGVPFLYFGPYVAKKHGGDTAGPRYVNVRLFHALDIMVRSTKSAITTVNWPVDGSYEVRRDGSKDQDVREYMATFFDSYAKDGLRGVSIALLASNTHRRLIAERDAFVANSIRQPEQYDRPPPSVMVLPRSEFRRRFGSSADRLSESVREIVLYKVGMNRIRSDPYTGMAMLYKYLYTVEHPSRALVLWFPNITSASWRRAAASGPRKDVRLYRITAAAILFSDLLLLTDQL